jgi:hypothetical protein
MGGLISYGVSIVDLYRRAPAVDKVLRGATQLGLTLPQSVVFRADEVIASGRCPMAPPWPSDSSGRHLRGQDPKGREARKLPVEDATLNLTTAKRLGLTVPPSLLLRADPAIE